MIIKKNEVEIIQLTKENIKLIYGKFDRFVDTWEFIKEEAGYIFSDLAKLKTKEDFKLFYDKSILDVCVAKLNDEIIGVSYIIQNSYKSVLYTGYCKKEYRTPKISVYCAKLSLKYYFEKYDINRIDIVGRLDNRLSRLISQRLGFNRIGIIPKFLPHNDVAVDYYYSTLLK